MDMLKKKNYLGIAGMIFMFLGVVLPFFKVELLGVSEGVSIFKSWYGWVIILMIFYSALVIFKEFLEQKIPFVYNSAVSGAMGNLKNLNGAKGLLIPAGISTLVTIYICAYIRKSLAVTTFYGINMNDIVKYGIGFYAEIIGIVCLAAHALIYKGEEENVQATPVTNINQQPVNGMAQGQNFNQPMNGYNQQNVGVQQSMNGYGQPQQDFNQPMMNQQPMNGYGQPNMGIQQPQQGFGAQPQDQSMMNNNQGNNGF